MAWQEWDISKGYTDRITVSNQPGYMAGSFAPTLSGYMPYTVIDPTDYNTYLPTGSVGKALKSMFTLKSPSYRSVYGHNTGILVGDGVGNIYLDVLETSALSCENWQFIQGDKKIIAIPQNTGDVPNLVSKPVYMKTLDRIVFTSFSRTGGVVTLVCVGNTMGVGDSFYVSNPANFAGYEGPFVVAGSPTATRIDFALAGADIGSTNVTNAAVFGAFTAITAAKYAGCGLFFKNHLILANLHDGTIHEPTKFGWSKVGDITNWTESLANSCGSLNLPLLNSPIRDLVIIDGRIAIFSDDSISIAEFSGAPTEFTVRENVASGFQYIRGSGVSVGTGCFFLTPSGVCYFNGTEVVPVNLELSITTSLFFRSVVLSRFGIIAWFSTSGYLILFNYNTKQACIVSGTSPITLLGSWACSNSDLPGLHLGVQFSEGAGAVVPMTPWAGIAAMIFSTQVVFLDNRVRIKGIKLIGGPVDLTVAGAVQINGVSAVQNTTKSSTSGVQFFDIDIKVQTVQIAITSKIKLGNYIRQIFLDIEPISEPR